MKYQCKTIAKIERAKNSDYGNPSFYITFTDYERARTTANASFAYEIGNEGLREGCDVVVRYTKRGTIAGMCPRAVSAGAEL